MELLKIVENNIIQVNNKTEIGWILVLICVHIQYLWKIVMKKIVFDPFDQWHIQGEGLLGHAPLANFFSPQKK